MRSVGSTAPSSADNSVVLPAPVPPVTRKASRAASIPRSNLSASSGTVPSAISWSRPLAMGRNTRSEIHVPAAAMGASTA
ncbi:Uncharacterised protein [Mycobacteroides abscessus subsp. abscessus]|nr:Uncharacterised protein [Mycobacteroides abscessus subsp. abscessus]